MDSYSSFNRFPLYRPKYLMSEPHYLRFLELCQDGSPFSWFNPGDTKYWEEGFSFAFYMQDGEDIHHNFKGTGVLTYNHEDFGHCYELYEILSAYLSQEQLMSGMFIYFEKDGDLKDELQQSEGEDEIVISIRHHE